MGSGSGRKAVHGLGIALGVGACVVLGGCGSASGVEEGAEVTVYAEAGLCREAQALVERSPEVEGVTVGVSCLSPTKEGGGEVDLAAVGADARRAVEDSTSVAYLAPRGPANEYSEPILDEAEIALIRDSSGSRALQKVLNALDSRDDDEAPRAAVWEVR